MLQNCHTEPTPLYAMQYNQGTTDHTRPTKYKLDDDRVQ